MAMPLAQQATAGAKLRRSKGVDLISGHSALFGSTLGIASNQAVLPQGHPPSQRFHADFTWTG
jgi:hypothetical protein